MSQYLDKDGASRIAENFLSKQAEQDAILRNLQFDLKEAEHALVKTIQGPAPLNIRALTRPLDDYRISGNTVQEGTPAPDAPVDVVGCGVRTENLFDGIIGTDNKILGERGGADTNYAYALSKYIPVEPNTSYIYHFYHNIAENRSTYSISEYDSNKNVILPLTPQWITENKDYSINFTTRLNTAYIRINWKKAPDENLMLNIGSTAKPYEPYGYKLPLTINGTEYPIYLGQVPATRRIRKLVLTGEENWQAQPTLWRNDTALFALQQKMAQIGEMTNRPSVNTHFISVEAGLNPQQKDYACSGYNQVDVFSNFYYIRLHFTTIGITSETTGSNAITAFKSWLAAQYAAGTPVTVWYVLATPTAGIVNEPLHKIGDYADTVSMAQAGIEISTTKGFNTITTDTTVLPSNIEVKGVINNA